MFFGIMSKLSDNRKLKFLVPLIVALVVVSVAVVALYGLVGNPNAEVNEAQDDMQVNIGSGYPGMVDMVSASIEKNQSTLNTTINVKEAIYSSWRTRIRTIRYYSNS